MKRLEFSIDIDAAPDRVWSVLWTDETYRKWTKFFAEGSHARSTWEEGAEARFFDGKGNGMICRVDVHTPNEQLVLKHLASIENGKEVPLPKVWEGGQESYFLQETDSGVTLRAETDSPKEYLDFFKDAFPKALECVKELAEE